MFSFKELGNCNPRMQRNTPTSTNAGYAHGCHHTSLLVLATTRRHAICNFVRDTCSPTEDHSRSSFTQSELDTLTQLSVLLQGCHRTSENLQPYIPHIRPHSHPPSVRRSLRPPDRPSPTDTTLSYSRATRQTLQDHRINSLHRSSTLSNSGRLRDAPSSFIVVTGGGVL